MLSVTNPGPGFAENFAHDPTARTWLPVAGSAKSAADTMAALVDDLLKPLHAQMRPMVCWYNRAELAASRAFASGTLRTEDSRWTCAARSEPVPGEADAADINFTFKLTGGAAQSAGIAVAFDFTDWSTDNYVLIPASVYNGNRNRIEYRGYCTGFDPEDFFNRRLPVTAMCRIWHSNKISGRRSR